MTNRDFYKGIAALLKEKRDSPQPSLEQFLTSLWFRASQRKTESAIPLSDLQNMLADSFTPVDAKLDDAPIDEQAPGFAGWDSIIRRQINDLRQMSANGQLDDEHRYFGIQASSRETWYNFDPCSYVECATAGSLGGWEEGDDTDRQYVPGEVAAVDEKGEIRIVDPRSIQQPPVEVEKLSWDQLKEFLWCGQRYE